LKQANIDLPTGSANRAAGSHAAEEDHKHNIADELKLKMIKVLDRITKNRISEPFRNPVTLDEAPDYFDVIRNPMDLATIRTKVLQGLIKNRLDFVNHINLIFENAFAYNEPGTGMWKMTESVKEFAHKVISEILPQDDEVEAEASPAPTGATGAADGVSTRGRRKSKEPTILKSGDYV
jgi:hypothetical protein